MCPVSLWKNRTEYGRKKRWQNPCRGGNNNTKNLYRFLAATFAALFLLQRRFLIAIYFFICVSRNTLLSLFVYQGFKWKYVYVILEVFLYFIAADHMTFINLGILWWKLTWNGSNLISSTVNYFAKNLKRILWNYWESFWLSS